MAKGRLRFAVLMDKAFTAFQQVLKRGIDRYLDEADIEVVFLGVGHQDLANPEDRALTRFVDMLSAEEFDGLLLITATLVNADGGSNLVARLANLRGLPMVSIGPSVMGEPGMILDSSEGMRAILRHLLDHHGYRRLAFVSGPMTNSEARVRLAVFRESLEQAGIEHDDAWEYEGNFVPASGAAAVAAFYDERQLQPEAIVCANDLMAVGVWEALTRRGLRVPFDVAVTGFDDEQLSPALTNQMTTVYQPLDVLGGLAMQRLHGMVANKVCEPTLPALELRIRNSCGCPPFGHDHAGHDSELENLVVEQLRAGTDDGSLARRWTEEVLTRLGSGESLYRLEQVLQGAHTSGAYRGSDTSLILNLAVLTGQVAGQAQSARHWLKWLTNIKVSNCLGKIQLALTQNDGPVPAEFYQELADAYGASALHVVLFDDPHDPHKGSKLEFSSTPGWEPGRTWFPPRGRTLVANMISHDEDTYGYILLSNDLPDAALYDALRIRLSEIAAEVRTVTDIRNLNTDLQHEIESRVEAERKLTEALALVEQLSIQDELTHLCNRRGFLTLAEQQIRYLRRRKAPFLVLYADLDGLKTINDCWGHEAGDLAIRSAAEVLKGALRESDIIARLGGDEFTALVSEATPEVFALIRERILVLCTSKNSQLARPWKVQFSLGHFSSDSDPDDSLELHQILKKADESLYVEKRGRRSGQG